MSSSNKPKIAYSLGEPAGVGADILLQLAQERALDDVVVIGDQNALTIRARQLGLSVEHLQIEHIGVAEPSVCGSPSVANVPGVLAMLDRAIDGCLQGDYAGVVTGPLHKGVINDAGIEFSGHTEYLAERTLALKSVMMLATDKLRVGLYTTHLPLSAVPKAITEPLIKQVTRIVDSDLRAKFGIEQPRILVCGLNPHAGEGGHLGTEEIDIIEPALADLRAEGLELVGPIPADTAFTPHALNNVDIVMAMYHDQGLPVLKAQGFGNAANITLGLPILRTSVDHGTAFDLAGSGTTDIGGLKTALTVMRQMVDVQKKSEGLND